MSDDLERRLSAWFAEDPATEPPERLRRFVARLPVDHARVPERRGSPLPLRRVAGGFRLVATLALAIAVVGVALILRPERFAPGPAGTATGSSGPKGTSAASESGEAKPTVVGANLIDEEHGWALIASALLTTADGGLSWQEATPNGIPAEAIRAVRFLDPDHGWAVGGTLETDSRLRVGRTSDGGRTWAMATLPGQHPDGVGDVAIEFVDRSVGWVKVEEVHGSASARASLYGTRDGGATWSELRIPGNAPVRFTSSTDGWTLGGPVGQQLMHTIDGGRTWSAATVSPPPGEAPANRIYELPTFFADRSGILPVMFYGPLSTDGMPAWVRLAVYGMSNEGRGWQFISFGAALANAGDMQTLPLVAVDQRTWITLPSACGQLQRTEDAGATWTTLAATGLHPRPSVWVPDVGFASKTAAWAIGVRDCANNSSADPGFLEATDDGGLTWRRLMPNVPTPATASPTTATSPSSSASVAPVAGLAWEQATGLPADREVGALIWDGSGFLAATWRPTGGAEIWRSTDGLAWAQLAGPAAFGSAIRDHSDFISGLFSDADGYVAVGASVLLDSSSGNSRSWISRDGIHWRASTMQSSLSDAEMNAVTRGDSGYVAVGSDGFPGASTQLGGASGAMVWTSPDGLTWTRVPGSRELAGGLMRGIVASRWGWFAYGSDLPLSQGVSLPPLWHSSDGWRWERDRKIAFPGFYRAIHALAPSSVSLVAAGSAVDEGPFTWTSPNGVEWARVAIDLGSPPPAPGATTQVVGIVPSGGELLMVGTLASEGENAFAQAQVWSFDGVGPWRLQSAPAVLGARAVFVAASDQHVVLVVQSTTQSDTERTVLFVGTSSRQVRP